MLLSLTNLSLSLGVGAVFSIFKAKQATMNSIDIYERGVYYSILLFGVEHPLAFFGCPPLFGSWLYYYGFINFSFWITLLFLWPFCLVVTTGFLFIQSQFYGEASQGESEKITMYQDELLVWRDSQFKEKWRGKKIPIETANEAFQNQLIDYKDVLVVFRRRYDIFKFSLTLEHLRSFVFDLLKRVWKHDSDADKADISEVYNRGNDFYGWFMDERMLYSMGYWENSEETDLKAKCSKAQTTKLDMICRDLLQLKEGDTHLDLGCGWGALVNHATKNYGTVSTGITLSQEQANHIAKLGKNDKLNIKVMNAWAIPDNGEKYDKISCVEMSEHIGVRDYQKFARKVRNLLKDDGLFYLQIAGLRRAWQYEDLVWGMFMNKYIFPGADASCSLGWDIEQLERAGFEINQVKNCGTHYGMTILTWYKNWVDNKKVVVAKYGEKSWRNWSIFLAWSHCIAMQGSSTVYMITMSKQFPNDKRSRYPSHDEPAIDRAKLFIDHDRNSQSKKLN